MTEQTHILQCKLCRQDVGEVSNKISVITRETSCCSRSAKGTGVTMTSSDIVRNETSGCCGIVGNEVASCRDIIGNETSGCHGTRRT
ncbi:hypothetical protein V6N11_082837 [Hibiscus sabdariffa]|uniref:Uncharacterized protein n=1 Tax=Hibiscus sabdariffa TaxID=183260 RepID=A0ABR2QK29_9ROSI